MNGIKNKSHKHLLLVLLLITNSLTACIFSLSGDPIEMQNLSLPPPQGYVTLSLPIVSHLHFATNQNSQAASLFVQDKLLIAKVFVRSQIKEKGSLFESDGKTLYNIDVPMEQVEKIIEHQSSTLHAYPTTHLKKSLTKNGEQPYEIIF